MDRYSPLISALEAEFSAERATGIIREIWSRDRWFRYPSFAETARYCADTMKDAGLSDVELLPVKADGKTPYGDWVLPKAWDARSASLRLAGGEGEPDRLLCDYETSPCSLIMYSAPCGATRAEAVLADDPEKAPAGSLRGKILVTGRKARDLVPLAVERGAIGIASDYIEFFPGIRDSREQMAGVHRWDNDFIAPSGHHGLFGFSLTPQDGALLRKRLQDAALPVILAAEADTNFYDGESFTVSAAIAGTDAEAGEALICAHLYEQGANDNASGCAAVLELARCIGACVGSGALPPPRRTIRFVLGHECVGPLSYMQAHPERVGKTRVALVADMLGAGAADSAALGIWNDPMASWSCIDALMPDILEAYQSRSGKRFSWREHTFGFGDSLLADPCFQMPSITVMDMPTLSYHSSLDTPERIDTEVLKRNAVMLGTLLLFAASMGVEEIPQLRELVSADIERRRLRDSDRHEVVWDCMQSRAYAGLDVLIGRKMSAAAGEELPREYRCLPEGISSADALRIPNRRVMGCLSFATRPDFAAAPWPPAPEKPLNTPAFWGDGSLSMPLFWADGKRNIWQIAVLSALEDGKNDMRFILKHYQFLVRYFQFLEENGYLSMESSQ